MTILRTVNGLFGRHLLGFGSGGAPRALVLVLSSPLSESAPFTKFRVNVRYRFVTGGFRIDRCLISRLFPVSHSVVLRGVFAVVFTFILAFSLTLLLPQVTYSFVVVTLQLFVTLVRYPRSILLSWRS